MMGRLIIFLLLPILLSCGKSEESENQGQIEASEEVGAEQTTALTESNAHKKEVQPNLNEGEILPVNLTDRIRGMGVLVMKSEPDGLSLKDTLTVLNSDNTPFLSWCYKSEYFKVKSDSYKLFEVTNEVLENYKIEPRAFYPEYQIIHFEVLGEIGNYYEVILNPENNTIKRIPKSSNWKFYTWEEYLNTVYLMYGSDNPLRAAPEEDAKVIYKFNDYFFKVIEIKGDWVKIQCNDDCKKCDKGNLEGWIKWKDGERLLVSLGIIC
jgi:hypothetical protein